MKILLIILYKKVKILYTLIAYIAYYKNYNILSKLISLNVLEDST